MTWGFLIIMTAVAAIAASLILAFKLGYKDGWDAHRDHERDRENERRLRADRIARAADRSRERRAAAGPWYQPVPPQPRTRRVVTTAGDTTPVTVIPVGPALIPLRPQPSRISGAGTVTLTQLTSTGELRAATDEFLEGLAARAERDRQEIGS